MSNKNIYVGNLNYRMDDASLQKVFEEYGAVKSARVIMDHETGRSKGFGFVEMNESNDAQKAIENLDGSEIEGRAIKVNEARPKNDSFSSRRRF